MSKRCLGCMKTYDEQFDVCPHCGYVDGTPAKEAYHLIPGTMLHHRYIVGKVIGYGGFGVTYAGWDMTLEQKVAIKEYLPSEFATRVTGEENVTVYSGEKANQFAIGRDKFSDEAKRLAQFNSVDGVVEIKDTFRDNETAYIVMEFLEGETLKERLEREKRIPPEEALPIIEEILATLEKVHAGHIIHRDISPDNIFLCEDGRVKLLDFGAARYATVQHSKSLSVILKEGYAPEEQYRSRGEQGSWSDVYAVAATMYKMLTGVTPEDAMERAENDKLKPVSRYGVKLSKEVNTAMMNALNVFSEDRTKTASEFITELHADEVKRKERTRKKIDIGKWPLWSKIAIGCIAVALAATGVVLSRNSVYALEEGQVYVPEIINLSDEDAQKKIEKNDLTLKIIGQEKTDKVDMGRVMTQYPDAGRVVNTGELVEAKISAGNTAEMVDLSGMTQEEAEETLEAMGFTNVEFVTSESGAEKGSIVAQNIETGEDASTDGKIVITISGGLSDIDTSKTVKVPSFAGMSYEEAVKKASAVKLYVEKGKTVESSKAAGTVVSQDISAGSGVKEGTTVKLNISAGEKKVTVPYVEYLPEGEAKTLLQAYGLKYSVSYKNSDNVAAGLVISQSTSSGKQVKPGTTIKLVVSEGRPQVSVPETVGKSYTSAIEALTDKEFRYAIVYTHSDSVKWGNVISASPKGKQQAGTKITLTVSKGPANKIVTEEEYKSKYSDSSKYHVNKLYAYRSKTREKERTTSGYSTLSSDNGNPWTLYDKKVSTSTSGYYYNSSYPSTKKTQYSDKYVVVETVSKGKYYYGYSYGRTVSGKFDPAYLIAKSRSTVISYAKQSFSDPKMWAESNLFYLWYIGPENSTENSTKGKTVNVRNDSTGDKFTTQVDRKATLGGSQHLYYYSKVYKKKTTTTVYCFERWSNWSDWSGWTDWQSSNPDLSDSDTKQYETTVRYAVTGKEPG